MLRQPLRRQRRTRNVPAEPLQPLPVPRGNRHVGVQAEARHLGTATLRTTGERIDLDPITEPWHELSRPCTQPDATTDRRFLAGGQERIDLAFRQLLEEMATLRLRSPRSARARAAPASPAPRA
jgi:hypothetical protein